MSGRGGVWSPEGMSIPWLSDATSKTSAEALSSPARTTRALALKRVEDDRRRVEVGVVDQPVGCVEDHEHQRRLRRRWRGAPTRSRRRPRRRARRRGARTVQALPRMARRSAIRVERTSLGAGRRGVAGGVGQHVLQRAEAVGQVLAELEAGVAVGDRRAGGGACPGRRRRPACRPARHVAARWPATGTRRRGSRAGPSRRPSRFVVGRLDVEGHRGDERPVAGGAKDEDEDPLVAVRPARARRPRARLPPRTANSRRHRRRTRARERAHPGRHRRRRTVSRRCFRRHSTQSARWASMAAAVSPSTDPSTRSAMSTSSGCAGRGLVIAPPLRRTGCRCPC